MKPRIMHIGPIPPEAGGKIAGGIATHVWDLAVQAQKRGWRVSIFAGTDCSYQRSGIEIIGLPSRNFPGKLGRGARAWLGGNREPFSPLSRPGKLRAAYLSSLIEEAAGKAAPDLIHLHSLTNLAGLSLASLGPPVPLAATNYELWFPRDCPRDLEIADRIARAATGLSHISEYTRERAQRLGIHNPGISRVIHIPVGEKRMPLLDRDRTRRELGLEGKKTVFFYGTYQPIRKKGLDILIHAFFLDQSLRENCRLVVRTGGDGAEYARSRFRRAGIDGRILGQVGWDEMAKYYNAADVFVMPSRSEGYGIAYVEALMAGTPAIGFYRTLKEIQERMGTSVGALFDAESETAEDLARKIGEVLDARFDRRLLRDSAQRNLSWEGRFGDFENFYQEVLNHDQR